MKFVVDTSLFINPKSRNILGRTPKTVIKKFIKAIEKTNYEVYMPPSVFKELATFLDDASSEELEFVIKKRAPNLYDIQVPAALLHKFISDMRERMNKGMRIAEQVAKEKPSAALIKKLREQYRNAVRSGIVDSVEDFELVLLAKELDAVLVTVDHGVEKLADELGVERFAGEKFLARLKKFL